MTGIRFINHADLAVSSLEAAVDRYRAYWKVDPTCLVVGPGQLSMAYRVVAGGPIPRLVVVGLPAFPSDAWLVCGSEGVFYSWGSQ